MSFRLKTVLGIACIEALLLTILVISGLHYLSSSNAAQLKQRANTTGKLVATMTSDAVIAVDLATLDVLVEQALRNQDIVYLRIRSANGTVLSEGGSTKALDAPFVEDSSIEQTASDRRFDIRSPITVAGSDFGQVELGLSTEVLDTTFSDAFLWMVSIALSEMILVALLGLALGHYLTYQLTQLKRGAKQIAGGDFGHQIPINGRDELADTAHGFNRMSEALAHYAQIAEEARQRAEHGRELAESTLRDALDSMLDSVLVLDEKGNVLLANQSYRSLYGITYPLTDIASALAAEATQYRGAKDDFIEERLRRLADPLAFPRWSIQLTDGRHLLISLHPMSKGGIVILQTNVSELYQALDENRELHVELMQRQKAEAIGTLASGIAHEINTPVQVMANNAAFVSSSVGDLVAMIDDMKAIGTFDQQTFLAKLADIDWEYAHTEIPTALSDLTDGINRVGDLVKTFKEFAKPGGTTLSPTDLIPVIKKAIDETKTEWRDIASINLDLDETVTRVPCQIDQIKQVLRQLIINAAHAIKDRSSPEPGHITLRLHQNQEEALLEIEDNGCGIAPEDQDRIYDMLFTTKEPGRGTGQGLALAHMMITRGHGGRIDVKSNLDEGTRFTISLPRHLSLSGNTRSHQVSSVDMSPLGYPGRQERAI